MFDEDTMPQWMKDKITNAAKKKESEAASIMNPVYAVDTSQPPPPTATMMGMGIPQYPMGSVPR